MEEIFRGWQGHFCCQCRWHLNTLVIVGDRKAVVSTVGQAPDVLGGFQELAAVPGCFYETMVFESDYGEFDDADVTRDLRFTSHYKDEKAAHDGHYATIEQVKQYLQTPVTA